MFNPNQLYDDMERLNALYEELCWAHDDELVLQQWVVMQQQVNLFQEYGKMMLLATLMFGAFIIHSMFTEDVDDDDHFDGGMLIPAQNPIQ